MKINCTVGIFDRVNSPSSSFRRRKSQLCILTIGKYSNDNKDIYIVLQTRQNKQGTKYKITNNIQGLFTKFLDQGKATITLLQPPVDIYVQSTTIHLRKLIQVLRLVINNKQQDFKNLSVSPNVIKFLPTKTKIVIKKNSEYPILKGFSKATEELYLCDLGRKSFDRQILELQNIKILNLSNNQISSLPEGLGHMPNLQELNLSWNQLGKSAHLTWEWLNQDPIKQNLNSLDLRHNSLNELPDQIGKLMNLVNLKVGQNFLKRIPQSIGTLLYLQYLDVSQNNLLYLPATMKNLRLSYLDISANSFKICENTNICRIKFPSLVELSAKCVIKYKKKYDSSLIPFTLTKYLDGAKYCKCGTSLFESYIRQLRRNNLPLTVDVLQTDRQQLIFECYFCSTTCAHSCYWIFTNPQFNSLNFILN